ncbi:MAG TPA: hypothetical protein VLM42_12565 [Bryobacteraceae bacterium]|nr:hypothetical protein [Bryobacteraceae bacterium]
MNSPQESALEVCQRAENILREVQSGELVPGTEMLAEWETELGQVAALLEATHGSMTDEFKPRNNPAVRQAILRIRQRAGLLKLQFEHGSNYCMGLLQVRMGTGYCAQGLPVLTPTEARSSFEG